MAHLVWCIGSSLPNRSNNPAKKISPSPLFQRGVNSPFEKGERGGFRRDSGRHDLSDFLFRTKGRTMRIVLFAATILLAGCASPRPTASTDNYNRDLSECEREAALSSAGSKAQALDSCMRARQHAPKQ